MNRRTLKPGHALAVLCSMLLVVTGGTVNAQQATATAPQQRDLTALSIEDLMSVHVTSVSKTDQKMSLAAAAIFVIGQADIRRSGATTIPDLLRMVPGLDVAQINANTWAVSARGFNNQFANKLLVLIDGRAVYNPLFAGVYWDAQDLPLEDIDRIEVIRGPGGAVWGDNAVNGVINVITKSAQDTQGALLTTGGGTVEQGFGTAQFGAAKGGTAYRGFVKYLKHSHFPDLNGQNGEDGSDLLHGGFRVDSKIFATDDFTVEGDIYTGSEGASIVHAVIFPPDNLTVFTTARLSGGNVLGHWSHSFANGLNASLQTYFDRYTRSGPESHEVRNTVDIEFQGHKTAGSRHDLTVGFGYRHTADQTVGTIDQAFVPADASAYLVTMFGEDQITVLPDRLHLYVGAKIQNNYFSGFEFEPSLRLAWTPSSRHTVWAAASRAIRAPSRHDTSISNVVAILPGPVEFLGIGNPLFKSEKLMAYELGYRTQINKRVSLDLATFFNRYKDLETDNKGASFLDSNSFPPISIQTTQFGNNMRSTAVGLEGSVNWSVSDRWTLSAGYSLLRLQARLDSSSLNPANASDLEGSSPKHQAQLRSHLDLPHHLSWNSNLYFVDRLPSQFVASYTRLDVQFAWQVSERMQASVVGQNLLADHHTEFNGSVASVNSSQVKRGAYAKLIWRF